MLEHKDFIDIYFQETDEEIYSDINKRIALANRDYISFINSEDYKSYIAFREMYNTCLLHHKDVEFSLI